MYGICVAFCKGEMWFVSVDFIFSGRHCRLMLAQPAAGLTDTRGVLLSNFPNRLAQFNFHSNY